MYLALCAQELCALAQFQSDAIHEINENIPSNIRLGTNAFLLCVKLIIVRPHLTKLLGMPVDANEAQKGGWGLLPPLTAAEFESVASAARGRVTLELVNNSLIAIRGILDSKREMLATNPKRMKRQMRVQYEEYMSLLTDEHQGQIYFTEDECRDTCIFQAGDATGKAVLTVLRQTKRLLMLKVRGKPTFIVNTNA
jgi:hypothetical protein